MESFTTDRRNMPGGNWKQDKYQDKPTHPAAYCPPGRGFSLSYIRGRCHRLLFGSALQAPECLWRTTKHPEGLAGS